MKSTIAVICITLISGILFGAYAVNNVWERKWSNAESAQYSNQLEAINAAVEEYKAKVINLEELENETKQKLADAQLDVIAATSTNDSLQQQLSDYVRESSGRANSAATNAECAAIATDFIVLSELFSRANRRAEELAKVADEATTRGRACEAAYELVR